MSEPLIPGGYILLSRKIIESEIWNKPPLYIKVWIYLLTQAQHSDYKKLKRGQLRTSIPEIREACSWYVGYRKETPSKDQIFKILNWLRNPYESNDESDTTPTMITTTKATQGMLVTIDNYRVYQDSRNYESNDEPNDEIPTKELRLQPPTDNTNKNVKNDKNEKDYTSQIKNLLLGYPSDIQDLITVYWNEIKKTRKSGVIQKSVMLKTMQKWDKYEHIVIKYSLKTHLDKYGADRDEKYTIGIMRQTTPDEALDRLNRTSYKSKQEPSGQLPEFNFGE